MTQTAEQTEMINLTIDDIAVSVPKGTTVYHAAKQLGVDLPIFCYQDRMPPFGACRVCLVEVEKMPKLQTSCTLVATEGMVVKTRSKQAVDGRESILEFLLINHPLDCPICDRGGECPLQDQTLKYGPGLSRFFEEKRHFKKPIPLGPVLMLDRERCIICARCVRFGEHVAGDHALQFIDRGYRSEVGTPDGGPAKSKFIGNTIMICPVGALTSRAYRFRARPWDNDQAETTCTLCPVGCSMILDSRDGEVMRTRSLENKNVNDIWMCDKGWFGYEFSENAQRLTTPLIKKEGTLQPATWEEAITLIAEKFKKAKESKKLAAIGGAPLTVEENYLYQKLFRDIGDVNHLDYRVGSSYLSLDEEGVPPGMKMTIGDSENLKLAILYGLDITEEFPVIWLRLSQAINKGAKVIFAGHYAPEVALQIQKTILHTPGKELEIIKANSQEFASLTQDGKAAIFVGRQYLNSSKRKQILEELQKFCTSNSQFTLNIMEGCNNSMGARFAGMHPELKPFNEKLSYPGYNSLQILESSAKSGWDYLHVAGANPKAKVPRKLWKEARSKLDFLVVQDLFLTETAAEADVVLPTLSFVEKVGTFINIEGRVEQIHAGKNIPEGLISDAEIFEMIANKLEHPITLESRFFDKLRVEKVSIGLDNSTSNSSKEPKPEEQIPNDSLMATFSVSLFDEGVRMQHNKHLSQLSKEPRIHLNPAEAEKFGLKECDLVSLTANNNTIKGRVSIVKTVAEKTVVLPIGFKEFSVYELSPQLINGMAVQIKKEDNDAS